MAQNNKKNSKININKVLDFAIRNKLSSIYKKLDISKIDFDNLPLSEKDDFVNIPLEKRTFLPSQDVLTYSTTSGTVDSKKLFTIPFSHPSKTFYSDKLTEKSLKKLGITKIMLLTHPLHGMVRHFVYSKEKMPPYILGKIDNLELCAKIIKETGIDGLVSTPTILEAFIPLAEKEHILKQIKWVIMAGEHCTASLRNSFKKKLAKALIDFAYGSTETGIMGLRCEYLKEDEPNIYHPTKELFIETLKDDGKQAAFGEEGQITVTSLEKTAFPLLRYRTGDLGILRKKQCKCGEKYTLEVLGRADFDSIKTKGVIIHAKAVEHALSHFDLVDSTVFKLDVFEGEKPQLVLHVKSTSGFLPQSFTDELTRKFWLSQKNTLYDLTQKEIFLPLQIKALKEQEKNASGKKRFIYYHKD